jgi:hypothetical protein
MRSVPAPLPRYSPQPTAPARARAADVARRTAERIDSPPELALHEPGLAACYAAAQT